ncbi:MAG: hypothetical protein PUP92_28215 [Rhizonema sp. PD38]|nr:hypothetical protein [Rhizonema sp. PD38]
MNNQNKYLVLLKLVLRSPVKKSRSFPVSALFISIFLLLSLVAIPRGIGLHLAQQPSEQHWQSLL